MKIPKTQLKKIEKHIENGFITVRKHPTEDLWIYNYTHKCQFDRVWDEETMMCRGLILDKDRNIIARPFKKFFNLGELEKVPSGKYRAFPKADGSLGILYWIKDKPFISTRGSFESEQAIEGTKMLHKMNNEWSWFKKEITYLFEIIYPENKIVIDYKGARKLIFLSAIDTNTGKNIEIDPYECPFFHLLSEKKIDINNIEQKENEEGYVLLYKDGTRVKIKFDEYIRLHKLITGVSERRIWDLLRNDDNLDKFLEKVPDEFFKWVTKIKEKYNNSFCYIEESCIFDYEIAKAFETRKEQAYYITRCKYPSVIFLMLDDKDYSQAIWKLIKPRGDNIFKIEE